MLDISARVTTAMATARPPIVVTAGLEVRRTEFEAIPVVTMARKTPTRRGVIVAIPGGGYAVRPTIMHWYLYSSIARRTGASVVVPVYPLATNGGRAAEVVPKIANLIAHQVAQTSRRVSVYGDSAGGGLALAAVQCLVADGKPLPASMVLVSPWLDVTMSNPAIGSVDDPVLDVAVLRESGLTWAGRLDPKDPLASPLYGSLDGLPPTRVFSGSRDVLYPDVEVLQQKAGECGAPMDFDLRRGLMHNWAMLPVTPAGREVLPGILAELTG
jgi:triacylglycerol lipase